MKILISADLVPTRSNYELFEKADINELFGEKIIDELKSADIRIFNLEVPFYDADSHIRKAGPVLKAPSSTFNGIKALDPTLASIANNHILDHGEEGLHNTIKILNDNNISYVGAGSDLSEAKKPYIIEKDGKKIGVYSCAEHEFSIATENGAGANPFDPLYSLDEIAELKSQVDFVIVLFHGGRELYRYPTPMQQRRCRRMVEKGADVVVCQHSHCVGCEEKYLDGVIVYGQGNFIFDAQDHIEWQTGLLTVIDLDKNGKFEVSYIPIDKLKNKVRKSETNETLEGFNVRSEQIKDEGFVIEAFEKESNKKLGGVLSRLLGKLPYSFAYKVFNKISLKFFKKPLSYKFYNGKNADSVINQIECESHRELLLTGLKQINRGDKK